MRKQLSETTLPIDFETSGQDAIEHKTGEAHNTYEIRDNYSQQVVTVHLDIDETSFPKLDQNDSPPTASTCYKDLAGDLERENISHIFMKQGVAMKAEDLPPPMPGSSKRDGAAYSTPDGKRSRGALPSPTASPATGTCEPRATKGELDEPGVAKTLKFEDRARHAAHQDRATGGGIELDQRPH